MATEIARHWRLNYQRYRLMGRVCAKCGQKTFPPREICPKCIDPLNRLTFDQNSDALVEFQEIAKKQYKEASLPVGESSSKLLDG